MRTLKLGIMSRGDFQRYTIAIAKGEIKPEPDAPKVWFDSLESMAQILSAENRELLHTISATHPQSLAELEEITGREKASLSRTLSKMAAHGLVTLARGPKNALIPTPVADRFEVAAFT
jgi:predicted transcriptional regulator